MFGQKLERPLAADAAERDDERDAGAGHIDAQPVAKLLLEFGPCVGGDHREEDGLFRPLKAEGGKGLLHGGAGAYGA